MAGDNLIGRLMGVVKNGVVWGAAWFGLTVATIPSFPPRVTVRSPASRAGIGSAPA